MDAGNINQIPGKSGDINQGEYDVRMPRKKKTYKWEPEKHGREDWYNLVLDEINITVMNCHVDHKGVWVMMCSTLRIHNQKLDVETPEEAMKKAVEIAIKKLSGDLSHLISLKNT